MQFRSEDNSKIFRGIYIVHLGHPLPPPPLRSFSPCRKSLDFIAEEFLRRFTQFSPPTPFAKYIPVKQFDGKLCTVREIILILRKERKQKHRWTEEGKEIEIKKIDRLKEKSLKKPRLLVNFFFLAGMVMVIHHLNS